MEMTKVSSQLTYINSITDIPKVVIKHGSDITVKKKQTTKKKHISGTKCKYLEDSGICYVHVFMFMFNMIDFTEPLLRLSLAQLSPSLFTIALITINKLLQFCL